MARALSVDLRRRVVDAIGEGMSRRQAAARFGVSASSAIRWAAQLARTGGIAPKQQGGDRRSCRIEGEAAFILEAVEQQPDVTLAELQAKLKDRGLKVGLTTVWRFFKRRRITLKKRPRMRPSSSAATSKRRGGLGSKASSTSTLSA
jgi:transposase